MAHRIIGILYHPPSAVVKSIKRMVYDDTVKVYHAPPLTYIYIMWFQLCLRSIVCFWIFKYHWLVYIYLYGLYYNGTNIKFFLHKRKQTSYLYTSQLRFHMPEMEDCPPPYIRFIQCKAISHRFSFVDTSRICYKEQLYN